MKINGTIMSYFYHCPRQCWLFYNQIQMEDNSEDVRIGRILHELQSKSGKSEIMIDGVKIDKITKSYIVEYKKSDSDVPSARMQLLLYLYKLKQKGIILKGKLEFIEGKEKKQEILELNEDNEKKLLNAIENIETLLNNDTAPPFCESKICKRCSYRDYCII